MPRYDYHCDTCGLTQEYIHPYDQEPQILCESCNKKMRRLVGYPAAVTWGGRFNNRALSKMSQKEGGTDDW